MSEGPPRKRLYKFYSLRNALRNLSERRLKVSTLDDLNDPFEFNGFSLKAREDRKIWNSVRQKLWSNKGLLCLSERWDNPVMWSHYAENHQGLCLAFDVDERKFDKVTYRPARDALKSLRQLAEENDVDFLKRSATSKYSHWRYEKEWRSFVQLEIKDKESGLYFVDFSEELKLRQVIIGANSNCSSRKIRSFFESREEPEIITARLAFHTFRVVKQRKLLLQK